MDFKKAEVVFLPAQISNTALTVPPLDDFSYERKQFAARAWCALIKIALSELELGFLNRWGLLPSKDTCT